MGDGGGYVCRINDELNSLGLGSDGGYLDYFDDGQSGIAELRKKFVQAREAAA